MENRNLPLSAVSAGKEVTLISISGGKGLKIKLIGMGLKEGMRIRVLHTRGFGRCVILAGNTRLAIGRGMAQKILVREEDGSWPER